jgi:maleylacetoacetate isomerase/maleylpyruvate isomerase
MLRLYTYFRSSAAYRVRIALNLKQLDYAAIPVHLLRAGGEQHDAVYAGLNPQKLVPTLDTGAGLLTQSLAILEYLEEIAPVPPLLPADAVGRAQVRSLALVVACEIHPLNNLRVLNYLRDELAIDKDRRDAWYRHWIELGLSAFEQLLTRTSHVGAFCYGDAPTLADCCVVPQVFNARRFGCPLDSFPNIQRIDAHCASLEAFQRAAPAAQADAET